MIETLFWIACLGVVYPYAGYPLALWVLGKMLAGPRTPETPELPALTMIVPVHNEAKRLAKKLANTAALQYPADRLEIIFVSDGSTDESADMIRNAALGNARLIELPMRGGKAAALNAGLKAATNPILVFTDASIELERDSLRHLVKGFADPAVGCISGEDRIAEGGGEGAYGKYEIFLRRLESQLHSIVGASGCFYAQRRNICEPFTEGMAPDFLSVLRTVEHGCRALTEPDATGVMSSVKDARDEFDRKVRTLIRGMTTLFAHPQLLNPFRYGMFAFALWSHKVLRWTVPFFLIITLVCSLLLIDRTLYMIAFTAQVLFYAAALVALSQLGGLHQSFAGKIAVYFSTVNAAILAAWYRYGTGVRQEIWSPSQR